MEGLFHYHPPTLQTEFPFPPFTCTHSSVPYRPRARQLVAIGPLA